MNLPLLPPLPDPRFDGFKRGGLLIDDGFDAHQLRTYAEQYGRLCAEAAKADEHLLREALLALTYHREQTRPIADSDAVIERLRTRLWVEGTQ